MSFPFTPRSRQPLRGSTGLCVWPAFLLLCCAPLHAQGAEPAAQEIPWVLLVLGVASGVVLAALATRLLRKKPTPPPAPPHSALKDPAPPLVHHHGSGMKPAEVIPPPAPAATVMEPPPPPTPPVVVETPPAPVVVAAEPAQAEVTKVQIPAYRPAIVPTGPARVLLMDDEESIQRLAARMLKKIGLEVEVSSNGEEAVTKYRDALAAGKRFDLVMMDLTVPGGMGGREALVILKQLDPGVRALVSSGYSNDSALAEYTALGFIGMVAKPYQIAELNEAVRKALAEGGSRKDAN